MQDNKQTLIVLAGASVAMLAGGLAAGFRQPLVEFLVACFKPESFYGVVALAIGIAVALLAFFLSLGALVRSAITTEEKPHEPIWARLNDSQISKGFMSYIEANSTPAINAGYIPIGTYLAEVNRRGRVETALLLHPQGHSMIHITRCGSKIGVEIQSLLDDGSVIRSCKISQKPHSSILGFLSSVAQKGFLVNLYPKATSEALIEAHSGSVEAALSAPNIGLRKLTVENWRQYTIYASRHLEQILFDLRMVSRNLPYSLR